METLSYGDEQLPASTPTAEGIVLHDTYRLVRQLGFGGMGVVYEAVHTRLPARFAVKVLLRSLMVYPEAFARFAREAQIMSELRHPNVVQILDFNVTDEQQPYFVMEYLDGHDLDTELSQRGPLSLLQTVSVVEAVSSALGTAHRRGIVHRDLKPSNVFLCDVEGCQEPIVKVLDFGVSKVRSAERITHEASMVGTPHYMAPEQATGRIAEVDGRTDQFSLAAMAHEMLTGEDAFVGDDQVSLLYQIVHEDPQPLALHLSWSCAGVQQVLSRALAKDPKDRYPSIGAFSAALAEAAHAAMSMSMSALEPAALAAPASAAATFATPQHAVDPVDSGPSWETATARQVVTADERELDLDLDAEVRVPRAPYRAVVLALIALALGGVIIARGWAPELPQDAVIAYRGLSGLTARLSGRPPLPQPDRSAPAPGVSPDHAQPVPAELTPTEHREAARGEND
jgi:eukaryotic-like serine/threonine-protein kinase